MSSSRLKPSVTPWTLFATSARMRPCSERDFPSSSPRLNCTTLSLTSTPMPGTTAVDSEPFGPFTVRVFPSWRTSTPFGSGIGFFPIRDMGLSLPDLAEDLAADAALGRLVAREDALRRRDDGEAEAAEYARDLLLVAVDAAARARDAVDAVDDRLAVGRVFEVDPQRPLRFFLVRERVVADEALALEDAGDLHLQLRGGELHAVMMRHDPIAAPRQHLGYWISHRHCSGPSTNLLS